MRGKLCCCSSGGLFVENHLVILPRHNTFYCQDFVPELMYTQLIGAAQQQVQQRQIAPRVLRQIEDHRLPDPFF